MANFEETQNQNLESDGLKFAIPEKGYGVYLKGILPEDQRVLAGAFSTSMQQITNISQVQLEKFAQAAYSNENMFGLNLVNGTDVPTDVRLARISQDICAVGAGVYGTFTMSNFFGAMSGLPYPLREIYDGIKQLETDKLKKIYQQIYLAVTAQQATFTVTIIANPNVTGPDGFGMYTYSYDITSIEPWTGAAGGGYGRADAVAPVGYLQDGSGATVSTTIDTNPNNVPGTYGKVLSATMSSLGTTVSAGTGLSPTFTPPSTVTVICQSPPDGSYAYPYIGGTNGLGTSVLDWNNINVALAGPAQPNLVKDANDEILSITTSSPSNFQISNVLNTNWDITGKALKQEQRARYISLAPVPIPFDQWIATYPTSQYVFVDGIPTLAANTLPHMYAQTLENISDLDFTGGQSVIAMMRESRNEERLNRAGLELDNNLASDMSDQDKEQLLTNGTLPGAIGDEGINGYTIPVYAGETPSGDTIPIPVSYYDPCLPGLQSYNGTQYVEADPTAAILSAPPLEPEIAFFELPPTPEGYVSEPIEPEILPSTADVEVPDQSFPCEGDRIEPIYGSKPAPVATGLIGTGSPTPSDPPVDYPVGVNQPPEIIPPNLDGELTASTLLPSVPTVQQAIDKVIACNCDCWVA